MVDLSLRQSSGLDLIRQIRQRSPRTAVLVLSMHHDTFYAERVLRLGVMGFLGKDEPTENVMEAIRKVLDGEFHFSGNMTEKLVGTLVTDRRRTGETSVGRLSDREMQVFEMIGMGDSTRVVARKLGLSIKTVETYRANIKEKLGLTDASQLLQRAVQWTQCARQEGAALAV